jgi:NADPH-dependent 2,4-dienoyl-CoA reductase/sulfur reductase-like enzyme
VRWRTVPPAPSPSRRRHSIAALRDLVVVGASLAGLRAVETARREGFDGRITLIGAEPHLPYDRPPLSKQFLAGAMAGDGVQLRAEQHYRSLDLEMRLGRRAVALEVGARLVRLDDGSVLPWDGAVIATGAVPWRPPGWSRPGVFDLRTLDDCEALRAEFAAKPRVVVVGAGFIGCEVAATARGLGLDVTLAEALPAPMIRGVGAAMGEVLGELHADHGVAVRCGVPVESLHGGERVEAVQLADGSMLPADVVVVGLGVRPETAWLDTSGLTLADGVVCDEFCAAAPGVYAAGDVARWQHPLLGAATRVEHWTNATEQGAIAMRNLLRGADAEAFAPVPYFWSDQYDVKLQVAGWPRADDEMRVVRGSLQERRAVVVYGRRGRLVGALTLNWPRWIAEYRRALTAEISWESGVRLAEG